MATTQANDDKSMAVENAVADRLAERLGLGTASGSNASSSVSLVSDDTGAVNSPSLNSPSTKRKFLKHLTDEEKEEFRVEDGSETDPSFDREALMSSLTLEDPELETRWYFRYFLGHLHANFATHLLNDRGRELVLLSVLVPEEADTGNDVKAILWRSKGSEHLLVPRSRAFKPKSASLDFKRILMEFGRGEPEKALELLPGSGIQRQLLTLEEQEGAVNFKFGVLYAKAGQETDDEMFSNEDGSEAFDEFCNAIGDRVELQGFRGYRGGLDVKNGSTGTHSIHTVEYGKEVMFHVSTLLPYSPENQQQIARKRHLGNDICNIVYVDAEDFQFYPNKIKSRFNHIFAVVIHRPDNSYRLKVYTKKSIPEYNPSLPNPPVFYSKKELRRFLIIKLMNGEKAALKAPTSSFAEKRARTLEALIGDIYASSKDRGQKSTIKRLSRGARAPSMKDVNDFRAAGQALKVGKIASGEAPTSTLGVMASAESALKEPWLPICITSSFAHEVRCGDIWHDSAVLATPQGVFRLPIAVHASGSLQPTKLIDGSVQVMQLAIDERDDIMVVRAGKKEESVDLQKSALGKNLGKQGFIYIIPLSNFVGEDAQLPLGKKTMKQFLLKDVKDCHLFAYEHTSQRRCRLAIASGSKLATFEYKTAAAGIEGKFERIKNFDVNDVIEVMNILKGSSAPGSSGCVLVGSLNKELGGSFDVIDIDTGNVSRVLQKNPHRPTVDPVGCSEIINPLDHAEQELMLSFNHNTIFCDVLGNEMREFDIDWPTRPHALAFVQPYVLAFATASIFVVTIKNGNLVKTISMPRLRLLSTKKDLLFCAQSTEGIGIYRIPHDNLSGRSPMSPDLRRLPHHTHGNVMYRKLSHTDFQLQKPEPGTFASNTSKVDTIQEGTSTAASS